MTRDELSSKLDVLRHALEVLERLPQASLAEFLADERTLYTAIHLLQVSIQALMDVGAMAVSRHGLPTPRSLSREVLGILEDAGRLPPGSADRFGPMFAFRNRVVHLYDRIDPVRVHEILVEERAEIEALLRLLLEALDDGE